VKSVYLAGPITGCTKGDANDWRDYTSCRLASAGITGISPLRCEPLVGDRYGIGYSDPRFGVPRAIAAKNLFDMRKCDLALVYFPPEEPAGRPFGTGETIYKWPSLGTLLELGGLRMADKVPIVVCENTLLIKHPVFDAFSSWLLTDLDEGIDVAIGVLQDYSQGNAIQRTMA
jgi:hypothetical protein